MEEEPQEATEDKTADAQEFEPDEIEDDPAYNPPDDEHLKDLKGG